MYLHVRKSKCRYQLIRASFPKNFCHINTIWKFGCSREDHDYCYVSCNERHQWQASVVTNTNLTDVNCSKRQRWQTLTVTNMDGNKRLGSRNYNQWINVWPSLKVVKIETNLGKYMELQWNVLQFRNSNQRIAPVLNVALKIVEKWNKLKELLVAKLCRYLVTRRRQPV